MDQNFICTQQVWDQLYPGRHVVVQNVTLDSPVPSGIAWALRPLPPTVTVVDPYVIDAAEKAREARDAEAFRIAAAKPRHSYTSPEVAALLGLTLDELTEAIDHCGLPKPQLGFASDWPPSRTPRSGHIFDGPPVDVYAERVQRLFGGRRKAVR
jgi:hypothetical protein